MLSADSLLQYRKMLRVEKGIKSAQKRYTDDWYRLIITVKGDTKGKSLPER